MKTIRICLGCGTPLPPDAPGGLCPQCLLKSDAPTYSGGATGDQPRAVPIPGGDFGSYRIVRLLGQGGMGEVYEAEHVTDGRRVALKVMSHELGTEQDRKRFLREGRLAASVNHPNVVYVFGSEEIEGVPVIAMELVRGGTLRDRLKSEKRLPIADAVESAIEVIEGLEAANAAGVLHRDIKPANCFVGPDGTVKVGDFGLSVSTLARGESLLTAKGSVLGTPAYASPEQLRGEELDVRSDIYSVGATLYHLLTGETPFGAQDFVKLITEVLDKTAVAPQLLRPEIPAELSRIVLRCLAKDRKERFQSYAQLRDALLPFRAVEVAPANPARRFLAGLIDDTLAYGPCLLFVLYWGIDPPAYFIRERSAAAALIWLGFYLPYLAYYTIGEGLFGAAIGKTLCGLRVVGPDGQLPGIRRALMRALIYTAAFALPPLALICVAYASGMHPERVLEVQEITDWLWVPLWMALFVTMRRHNGYAAIHDLLTRTRVTIRPRTEPRPALPGAASIEQREEPRSAFGPYAVRGTLWQTGQEQLLLAEDSALQRKVWIHVRHNDAPPVPAERRDLSRPARLRWLTSGTSDASRWDAYEAVNGRPLLQVPQSASRWIAVRFWLLDLAEELAAQINAGSGPFESAEASPALFALDRIWISSSGRAVLLDFPAMLTQQPGPTCVHDIRDLQRALAAVVEYWLPEGEAQTSAPQVPLHARSFLDSVRKSAFEKAEYIIGNLTSLVSKPPEISRSLRVASLSLLPAALLLLTSLAGGIASFERIRFERAWAAMYPGQPSLYTANSLNELTRDLMSEGKKTRHDVNLVRTYMAHHFAWAVTNDTLWKDPRFTTMFEEDARDQLREIIRDYSSSSPTDLEEAERVVPGLMHEHKRVERLLPVWVVVSCLAVFAFWFALVGLVAAIVFRTVPTLNLFGIAVVDRAGRPASRLRLVARWAVVWLPTVALIIGVSALVGIAFAVGAPDSHIDPKDGPFFHTLAAILVPAAAGAWFAFVLYAALHPTRTLQDRLTRTFLVVK